MYAKQVMRALGRTGSKKTLPGSALVQKTFEVCHVETVSQKLIFAGIGIPIVFWVTLTLCGILFGEYSHFSNLVSELGATGTRTQALFSSGLLLCSTLSLVFVVGLFQECQKVQISTIPALVILTFTFSIAGAAIYPLPHPLHGILGSPSVFLFLSPVLAVVLWRRVPSLKRVRLFSVFSFLIMSLGFLAFFPGVLENYPGLKQRFFHVGWSTWFGYLAIEFSGLLGNVGNEQNKSGPGPIGAGRA